tara:strand:- start:147 stop:350 length:204 start_codon:yes stop_codon:yes gene_type:complete
MEAPLFSSDIQNICRIYKENIDKFKWYTTNVINPSRVAYIANDLNTVEMKMLKYQVENQSNTSNLEN